jgi:hypothetical protein
MVSFDYTPSHKEFDMEEDIGMLLFMHKKKSLNHVGSVFGRGYISRLQIYVDLKLMIHYFTDNPVFRHIYFCPRFRKPLYFYKHYRVFQAARSVLREAE